MQDKNYEAIRSLTGGEKDKVTFMIENMQHNKAFIHASKNLDKKEKDNLLISLQNKYLNYRKNWKGQPKKCFEKGTYYDENKKKQIDLLCLDLELASICDLACPHCFRQSIPTPDKIMSKNLAFKLIDQASALDVPSMKFNWRGEPLLNPRTPEIIEYAKKKGVLETIINTNATMLNEKMSKKIINSGLDLMIYSFDGGTKKSYEKMRPGRFKENSFKQIIQNIKNFAELKKKDKSIFPRTKIQMVLTKETRTEVKSFFNIFKDCVDDVSLKQYSERGGNIEEISKESRDKISQKLKNKISNLKKDTSFMIDSDDNIFLSNQRLPCEQPFQRLLVTYDGKVSMCCYDWGVEHSVGFVDELSIKDNNKEYDKIYEKSKNKEKSFELMNLRKINNFSNPDKKISSIKDIWNNQIINNVRELHLKNKMEDVKICKNCTFKDTYQWIKQ